MPRPSRCRWSLLLAMVSLAGSVHAEQPSINLRGFTPPPGPKGMLYLESVNSPGHLQFNTAGWLSWGSRPLVTRQGGEVADKVVSNQTSLDLAGAIGLGKRVEVGVVVPVVLYQGSESSARTAQLLEGSSIPGQALGDPTLAAKFTLRPVDEEMGGLGLALVGRFGLPLGNEASTVAEGALTTEIRPVLEARIFDTSLLLTTGYKLRTEERTFGGKTWGDEIPWGFGVSTGPRTLSQIKSLGLKPDGHWRLGLEAHGALTAGPDAPFTSRIQAPAYLGANGRYIIRDLTLLLGAETALSQAAGGSPIRLVFGANWAPRDHDMDKDGIEDEVDACPKYPEDRDGFEDKDGCPEPDNDDDNVIDKEDKCPLEPEDEDDFQDEDGCPDPDNDKDGILDVKDACPNEAGPASNDPQKNGCPDRDKDRDGVEGDDDKCPEQPEDKDGFQDEDGCPDPDNDGDGINDKEDKCPDEKGEVSLLEGQNGCPSPDRDRDAIPNDRDKCPDQPENYNGFEDDDGCPDTPKGKPKPIVEFVERRGKKEIVLNGPLKFTKGSTELDARSAVVARALATEMATRPDTKIAVAVRPAPADGGEDLARRRTQALVTLLIQGSRRPVFSAAEWTKGKMPPKSEAQGVDLALVAK